MGLLLPPLEEEGTRFHVEGGNWGGFILPNSIVPVFLYEQFE